MAQSRSAWGGSPLSMELKATWRRTYGEHFPLAFLLRASHSQFWFRIHSLPESKRYPEDEEEMQEVLRRYNAVAHHVLGEESNCLFLFPDYALKRFPSIFAPMGNEIFGNYTDEDMNVTLLGTSVIWQQHHFDAVLRHVANDDVRYALWMNRESGEIFAPYDGGADLFLNMTMQRDMLRRHFREWLSQHPQGL